VYVPTCVFGTYISSRCKDLHQPTSEPMGDRCRIPIEIGHTRTAGRPVKRGSLARYPSSRQLSQQGRLTIFHHSCDWPRYYRIHPAKAIHLRCGRSLPVVAGLIKTAAVNRAKKTGKHSLTPGPGLREPHRTIVHR